MVYYRKVAVTSDPGGAEPDLPWRLGSIGELGCRCAPGSHESTSGHPERLARGYEEVVRECRKALEVAAADLRQRLDDELGGLLRQMLRERVHQREGRHGLPCAECSRRGGRDRLMEPSNGSDKRGGMKSRDSMISYRKE